MLPWAQYDRVAVRQAYPPQKCHLLRNQSSSLDPVVLRPGFEEISVADFDERHHRLDKQAFRQVRTDDAESRSMPQEG